MDADALYDEFGNYIGPELDSATSDDDDARSLGADGVDEAHNSNSPPAPLSDDGMLSPASGAIDGDLSTAIVLAEDKQYYATAAQVFGPDTEAMVEEEDTQHISEPLVAPQVTRVTVLAETPESAPRPVYDHEYFASAILSTPGLCRNVALVGNLASGKTTLADMMFRNSHHMPWPNGTGKADMPLRYMDSRPDEQRLHISIKTNAAALLLPSSNGKSYGITVLDTPGHPNFIDEALAAMSLVDGVIFLVDAAEGVGLGTEILLQKAASLHLDVVLVVSKIDRLILELRLPPSDAYHKIRHVIDEVNAILIPLGGTRLSPGRGNVAFAAATEQMCFTLRQFAAEYVAKHGGPLSPGELAKRLWGDSYYNHELRTFTKLRPPGGGNSVRTFVEFVLNPLYKLHTAAVSDDIGVLSEKLARNGIISLKPSMLKADVRCLLRTIMGTVNGLGSTAGLVDMVTKFVQSPVDSAARKLESMGILVQLDGDDDWARAALECRGDRSAPMTGYVGKLIPHDRDGGKGDRGFRALFRVISGQLRVGDHVRVLGDSYHVDRNDEEQARAVVERIYLPCARFAVEVSRALCGQIVLVKGIDDTIFKSATVVSAGHPGCARARILRPLSELLTPGCVKIAVEPIRPSELPKMVAGLRMCMKSYPGLSSKVEESGEHTLLGAGELYLDCVMRDLRETFAEIQIKVSDPVVPFAETVIETSALQCEADTPNKLNKLTMIAEPLEEEVVKALAAGVGVKATPEALRDLGWDALAAKSLWSFGPHTNRGPNALINDVLDVENKDASGLIRDSVVQGFHWATREGPLTDEPVRGVKFRLLDAVVAESPLGRSPAQVIPAARRVAYSSMLTASARLLEPIYLVEVTCPQTAMSAVYTIIQRRRGTALSDGPVAGTPLFVFRGLVPVLDAFGMEADIRGLTNGAAFVVQVFDHWAVIPGDPLDKSVVLRPLEPAGRRELARECMVKTRRRKGMPEEVSIVKYFDASSSALLAELARDDPELKNLL
jgi:116 kDa U5 small nuclear ribonucleoprotein component